MKYFIIILAALLAAMSGAAHADKIPSNLEAEVLQLAPNLNSKAVHYAVEAYQKAREQGIDQQAILTVVDFEMPSTQKRLWVFDLKHDKVLFNTYVTHGHNSGDGQETTSFSNSMQSHKSSLGLYETGHEYVGEHGYSLRLIGLERGFNNNAYDRSIVVHGAWYATDQFVQQHHMLGRSWGCFAMDPQLSKKVIKTIKNGSLIFAYYPNHNWIRHSTYL